MRMSQRKLGNLMMLWRGPRKDPIHVVGVQLASGDQPTRRQVEKARDSVIVLLGSRLNARSAHQLRMIERGLEKLLHTYRYGELPDYDEFRQYLRDAVDSKGNPIVGDPPEVFQFNVIGRSAEIAEEAACMTPPPRRIRIRRGIGRTEVTIGNYRTLYNYLLAVSAIRGQTARRLGRRLAGAVGIRWT